MNLSRAIVYLSAAIATCPFAAGQDIPTTAAAAGGFFSLSFALTATGLKDALSEPNGPFTVFAPNDEAFGDLPAGLLNCLLSQDDLSVLSEILTYHVIAGATVLSTDLFDDSQVTTLSGETVTVDLEMGVEINDSTVIAADVMASNGVIHVIDTVLVPSSTTVTNFINGCLSNPAPTPAPAHSALIGASSEELEDLVDTADAAGSFGILLSFLKATDLEDAVSEPNGPFTVFAPPDSAFTSLPCGLLPCLMKKENLSTLTDILLYHVVAGSVLSTSLMNGMVPTLEGNQIRIDVTNGVTIDMSTTVSTADVEASNGIIHIVDSVLVPPDVDVQAFLATCV